MSDRLVYRIATLSVKLYVYNEKRVEIRQEATKFKGVCPGGAMTGVHNVMGWDFNALCVDFQKPCNARIVTNSFRVFSNVNTEF